MHNWDFHEAFTPLLDILCGRQAETKACLFWVCKRSLVWCGDGKWTVMSRRTSGNENKNKAAVYGKRHEGRSSDELLKAEWGTLLAPCKEVVTFPPLCLSGHCVRSLLLFALGVTGTPLAPPFTGWNPWKCLKKCTGVVLWYVVKWWAWQSGVNAWTWSWLSFPTSVIPWFLCQYLFGPP